MRRVGAWAAWAGLLTLEFLVAITYGTYGTWWHWLLHQQVGWGVGLATAALVGVASGRRVPATPPALTSDPTWRSTRRMIRHKRLGFRGDRGADGRTFTKVSFAGRSV